MDESSFLHHRAPILGLVAATVLLPSLAFAGGRVEERADGGTVVHVMLWALPSPEMQDAATLADIAIQKAFREHYTKVFAERLRAKYEADPATYGRRNWSNVSVELEAFSGIKVEGVETDLLAIAGGMAPDILYINFRKSDNYIRNGFLYPLDKPADGYLAGKSKAEIDFRINPKLWPVIDRKGPGGEKHVWAMPYGGAVGRVLLYRKDLFDKHGIVYPTVEWTWEDMLAAARKTTNPKEGIYGIMFEAGKHESWCWVTFLWSAGGDAMAYNKETGEWRCVFDSRQAAVALDFYTRLSAERWTDAEGKTRRGYAYKSPDMTTKWNRGEIAMRIDYIEEELFSKINPELVGMAPVPLGPPDAEGKRIRGAELNSRMMGLFAGIKDPVVRDAAWEYMWFVGSKQAMEIKTRVMVEGGFGQFVNPRYLRMFGYTDVERLAPKGWGEIFRIAIETGQPEPYGKNSNLAYDMMTIPMHRAEQMAFDDELPEDPEQRLDVLHGLLREANAQANEKMIGLITPAERRRRDIVAGIVLLGIVTTFFFVFRKIWRAFTPAKVDITGEEIVGSKWGFRRYVWAYVLLLPAVVTILLWRYVPLIRGSVMAFQDYRLMGDSSWVWLQNFGDLLFDNVWWRSVYDAVRYSFLVVTLTFLPPIILAILLQEVPRGTVLFRTIYYLPAVITGLVTIVLWKQFYDPSEKGALNALILTVPAWGFLLAGIFISLVPLFFARRLFQHRIVWPGVGCLVAAMLLCGTVWSLAGPILIRHGESVADAAPKFFSRLFASTPEAYRWLGDPDTAMISCVIPMVWAGMGPGCLIYLAALKGIPDDYYEAASIDGATFIDKILFVIFPILKPLVIINFIGVFIGSWYGATGRILAMTGGGANTEVAGLYIFYTAFMFLKFGPATAAAWVLAFMLIGFTVHQLRILSRLEFRTTGGKK